MGKIVLHAREFSALWVSKAGVRPFSPTWLSIGLLRPVELLEPMGPLCLTL